MSSRACKHQTEEQTHAMVRRYTQHVIELRQGAENKLLQSNAFMCIAVCTAAPHGLWRCCLGVSPASTCALATQPTCLPVQPRPRVAGSTGTQPHRCWHRHTGSRYMDYLVAPSGMEPWSLPKHQTSGMFPAPAPGVPHASLNRDA